MLNQPIDLHENDRKIKARELGMSLERFDNLLDTGNKAHDFIVEMGPFHGQEDLKEPNFRITAEPIELPQGSKKLYDQIGNDILVLGRSLPNLPQEYKHQIGNAIDLNVPILWRIDSILDKKGQIKINEIEGIDSASALMMAEQLAYGLQTMDETTVARFIVALEKMNLVPKSKTANPVKMAILRYKLSENPLSPNARRFGEWMKVFSKGRIEAELFDIDQLRSEEVKPDWQSFDLVLPEAYVSPLELEGMGIEYSKLVTSGNYNAIVNKGLFALVHDPKLSDFWTEQLGEDRFNRLKKVIINSKFINSAEELNEVRKKGNVAKITWGDDMFIVNGSRGVAIPTGDVKQGTDERWDLLHEHLKQDYKIIEQDYVEPARIHAYLRKRGTSLEPVEWYNRICVKYVVDGNPNGEEVPNVFVTAVEVTLGPQVVPAGRQCAYTAGELV